MAIRVGVSNSEEITMRMMMKSAMAGALVSVAVTAWLTSGAAALPCATTAVPYSVWVNTPGFNCTITDQGGAVTKTFSNFSFASSTVPLASVNVMADPGLPSNQAGLFFQLPLVVPPSPSDAAIDFMVASTAPITDASLHIVGSLGSPSSTGSVDEVLSNGVILHTALPNLLDSTADFAGVAALIAVKDAIVTGANGTTISVIREDFSQSSIPEPASLGILGLSLLGMSVVYRRVRK